MNCAIDNTVQINFSTAFSMQPEDIWFNAPRKGIMVFALPGERGLADLDGDFKVLFHDRHGDFYWYFLSPSPKELLEKICFMMMLPVN